MELTGFNRSSDGCPSRYSKYAKKNNLNISGHSVTNRHQRPIAVIIISTAASSFLV